jgi:hypothetical protein
MLQLHTIAVLFHEHLLDSGRTVYNKDKTAWFNIAGEGTGLLRLHSTYRHDLKIYSSDEGRVQVFPK